MGFEVGNCRRGCQVPSCIFCIHTFLSAGVEVDCRSKDISEDRSPLVCVAVVGSRVVVQVAADASESSVVQLVAVLQYKLCHLVTVLCALSSFLAVCKKVIFTNSGAPV